MIPAPGREQLPGVVVLAHQVQFHLVGMILGKFRPKRLDHKCRRAIGMRRYYTLKCTSALAASCTIFPGNRSAGLTSFDGGTLTCAVPRVRRGNHVLR
jgi:hypothetical protein